MATWSSADLATHVLRRLGIVGAGQSASAEDTTVVTDAWASLHPYLRRHGLAPWSSEAIEEEAQEAVSKWVASQIYSNWGITGEREMTVLREGERGRKMLEEVAHGDRTVMPTRPQYF